MSRRQLPCGLLGVIMAWPRVSLPAHAVGFGADLRSGLLRFISALLGSSFRDRGLALRPCCRASSFPSPPGNARAIRFFQPDRSLGTVPVQEIVPCTPTPFPTA